MTHILDCDLKITSTVQAAGHQVSENTEITSVTLGPVKSCQCLLAPS